MKSTILALLAATANAQAPDGTAAIDGGELDAAGYVVYQMIEGFNDCDTNADCSDLGEDQVCAVVFIGANAELSGKCLGEASCGEFGQVIDDSEDQWGCECNNAETTATGEDLDIADYLYWNKWINDLGLDTCTADSDCTASGYFCGTNTLDTATGLYCILGNSWCSSADALGDDEDSDDQTYTDGQSWEIANSLNKHTTSCVGDDYMTWLWQTNNEATQSDDCNSALEGFDADEDECAAGTTCGTATMTGYSVLGCYADADCEALVGSVPDTTDVTYDLLCGATGLFASTLAAIGVVSQI